MHRAPDRPRAALRAEGLRAAWTTLGVWSLLAAGAGLRPGLGREGAVLVSFALAAGVVLASRPRRPPRHPPGARGDGAVARARAALRGPAPAPLLLSVAAGYASFPAWIALTAALGLALGWAPVSPTPPVPGGPALALATLALAPLFEELLYRERLLPPLRGLLGAPLAVALSSACFALPHLERWHVLATFLVGLGLGALYLVRGRVALCVGAHAGLNLAAWVCGSPPQRLSLGPAAGAAAGLLLVSLARAGAPEPDAATAAAGPARGRPGRAGGAS